MRCITLKAARVSELKLPADNENDNRLQQCSVKVRL